MRIRTHHGTVRWSPSLEEAVLVAHHLFAGEHLRTRQGLALLLPLAQLRLKPFQIRASTNGSLLIQAWPWCAEIWVFQRYARSPKLVEPSLFTQSARRSQKTFTACSLPTAGSNTSLFNFSGLPLGGGLATPCPTPLPWFLDLLIELLGVALYNKQGTFVRKFLPSKVRLSTTCKYFARVNT